MPETAQITRRFYTARGFPRFGAAMELLLHVVSHRMGRAYKG